MFCCTAWHSFVLLFMRCKQHLGFHSACAAAGERGERPGEVNVAGMFVLSFFASRVDGDCRRHHVNSCFSGKRCPCEQHVGFYSERVLQLLSNALRTL
jgi:hypothetical protein